MSKKQVFQDKIFAINLKKYFTNFHLAMRSKNTDN